MDIHHQKQLAGILPTRPSLQEARKKKDDDQAKRDKDSLKTYGVKWRTTKSGHEIGISDDGRIVKGNPNHPAVKDSKSSAAADPNADLKNELARIQREIARLRGGKSKKELAAIDREVKRSKRAKQAKAAAGSSNGSSGGSVRSHASKLQSDLASIPGVKVEVGKGMAGHVLHVTQHDKDGNAIMNIRLQTASAASPWKDDSPTPPKLKATPTLGSQISAYGNSHSGTLEKVLDAIVKRMKKAQAKLR